MRSIDGVVTIVQETRFELLDDDGVGHLFLLDHGAAPEPEQLPELQQEQRRVRVSYADVEGIIGHMAKKIMLLDPR